MRLTCEARMEFAGTVLRCRRVPSHHLSFRLSDGTPRYAAVCSPHWRQVRRGDLTHGQTFTACHGLTVAVCTHPDAHWSDGGCVLPVSTWTVAHVVGQEVGR